MKNVMKVCATLLMVAFLASCGASEEVLPDNPPVKVESPTSGNNGNQGGSSGGSGPD